MKKLYFAFSFVLILFISVEKITAQAYTPFPDTAAIWNVHNGHTDGIYIYQYWESIQFGGTVNALGNTYKELIKNVYFSIYPIMGGNGSTGYYIQSSGFAIRQGAGTHIVYALDMSAQQEKIFIDFNFQLGDTLSSSNIIWGESFGPNVFYITSLDSVLMGTSYRKRYNFQQTNGQPVFTPDTSIIEGIGSTSGLFWAPLIFEAGGTLQCFSHFGNQLYPTLGNSPCGIISVSEQAYPEVLNIYADFSAQLLHIKIPNAAKNYSYLLMDIAGKKISEGKLLSADNAIDIRTVASGVYFVKVLSAEKSLVRKFVKP